MGGIKFGTDRELSVIRTRLSLIKIKEILEDSNMIKINNKRYWDFWKLIEQTEKELF
jgi:hypothetical protein